MLLWLVFTAGLLVASLFWWAIAAAYMKGYEDAESVCDRCLSNDEENEEDEGVSD